MPESFGARLRQRREARAIDLRAIAEQTKIKLSLLESLERDDVSRWPAGIFRRAYVRTYAHAIGLDPDTAVREFLEVHPDPEEMLSTDAINAAVSEGSGSSSTAPARLKSLLGSAFGSLSRRQAPAAERPAAAPHAVAAPMQVESDSTAGSTPTVVEAEAPPKAPERSRPAPAAAGPDLAAIAALCTDFGRISRAEEIRPLLGRAAAILGAEGLIVWIWDPRADVLRAALAHGYSDRVVAQLPSVRRADHNATAAAFRSAQVQAVGGRANESGALAVPLMTIEGCAGVLAVELQEGREQQESVRAAATIVAALLAQLTGPAPAAEHRTAGGRSERVVTA